MLDHHEHPPTIIVVEDDPVLSIVLQRVIRKLAQCYEIVHAVDGYTALAQLEQRYVPLVITDYNLRSSMDGLKLIGEIRRRRPETRIVLITAYATFEVEQAAAAQGVEFYLPKPFLLQDLEEIVRTVLSISQSQDHPCP